MSKPREKFKNAAKEFATTCGETGVSVITWKDEIDDRWFAAFTFLGNGDDASLELIREVNNLIDRACGDRDQGVDDLIKIVKITKSGVVGIA